MSNKYEESKNHIINTKYINSYEFYEEIFSDKATLEKVSIAYKEFFEELFATFGGVIGLAKEKGIGEEIKTAILELIDNLKLDIINYL